MAVNTSTVVASAARTTNADSGALVGFSSVVSMRLQLIVSAVSGTSPTLDVVVEDSADGTNWNNVGTFAQLTAAGTKVVAITGPTFDNVRIRWTIGGTATPTFTFSVFCAAKS